MHCFFRASLHILFLSFRASYRESQIFVQVLAPATDAPLVHVCAAFLQSRRAKLKVLDDLGFKNAPGRSLFPHCAEDTAFLTTAKTERMKIQKKQKKEARSSLA